MKTNRLVYKVQKTFQKMDVCVKISLDDDCKNGAEDFSITGTIYQAGKVHSDKNMIGGGCCHDEILKAFPEFEIFVKLHLADYKGVPMYAIENGFYHLPNKPVAMDYLRISESEYNSLKDLDKLNFSYQLFKLGIVQRWEDEANQAIKELERLTGLEFESKSTKSHIKNLAPEEIALITEREKSGYYSTKAIQDRKKTEIETARQKKYDEIKATFDKAVKIAQNEYDVYKFVLDNDISTDNMIYYNHTNKLCFNWLNYRSFITVEELTKLQESAKTANLPEGIKIEFSTK